MLEFLVLDTHRALQSLMHNRTWTLHAELQWYGRKP